MFNIGVGPLGLQAATTLDILMMARLAEKAEFQGIWVGGTTGRTPIPILSAASQVTKNLKLVTSILNMNTVTPIDAAMQAATIDELSDGRFILGLGLSTPPLVKLHGLKFEKPLARTREYVEIVTGLLEGKKITCHGKCYKIYDVRIRIRSMQKKLPVYLAALNPKMITLAGKIADGILLNIMPVAYVKKAVEIFRESAKNAGRNPDKLIVASYIFFHASERSDESLRVARLDAKKTIAYYASARFYDRMFRACGFADEVYRIQAKSKAENSVSILQEVSDKMVNELMAVGDIEQVRKRLEDYASAGLTLPILLPYPAGRSVPDAIRTFFETLPKVIG